MAQRLCDQRRCCQEIERGCNLSTLWVNKGVTHQFPAPPYLSRAQVSRRLLEREQQVGCKNRNRQQLTDRGPGQNVPCGRPVVLIGKNFAAYSQHAACIQQQQGRQHQAAAIEHAHSAKAGNTRWPIAKTMVETKPTVRAWRQASIHPWAWSEYTAQTPSADAITIQM